MTHRVFVHPGPLKTGTTYLQSLLYANRDSLHRQGVAILGDQGTHYRVATRLLGLGSSRAGEVPMGAWKRMRTAVLRTTDDVVMSCERYSLLGPQHVRQVLDDLSDREVHVILTLRDLSAVLPSRWQENVKNGGTRTWGDYQQRLVDDPARVRRATRAVPTLETWAGALPAERVHVVTVPPPTAPRTVLLQRFCEVIGVDPARLETVEAPRANPSMDWVSTELIRRVNEQDVVKLAEPARLSEIKAFLARELVTHQRGKPELTAAAFEAARAESRELVRRVQAGGFHVVGDLGDLTASGPTAGARGDGDVGLEQLVESAAVCIAALAQRSWELRVQVRKRGPGPGRRWARRARRRAWRRLRR